MGCNYQVDTLSSATVYADDQVLISKWEDELQISAHHLNTISKKYNLKISTSKRKEMGMCGSDIRRLKIMTDWKITDHVTEFKYWGNRIKEFKRTVL